jgi:hypothetical protein
MSSNVILSTEEKSNFSRWARRSPSSSITWFLTIFVRQTTGQSLIILALSSVGLYNKCSRVRLMPRGATNVNRSGRINSPRCSSWHLI